MSVSGLAVRRSHQKLRSKLHRLGPLIRTAVREKICSPVETFQRTAVREKICSPVETFQRTAVREKICSPVTFQRTAAYI